MPLSIGRSQHGFLFLHSQKENLSIQTVKMEPSLMWYNHGGTCGICHTLLIRCKSHFDLRSRGRNYRSGIHWDSLSGLHMTWNSPTGPSISINLQYIKCLLNEYFPVFHMGYKLALDSYLAAISRALSERNQVSCKSLRLENNNAFWSFFFLGIFH